MCEQQPHGALPVPGWSPPEQHLPGQSPAQEPWVGAWWSWRAGEAPYCLWMAPDGAPLLMIGQQSRAGTDPHRGGFGDSRQPPRKPSVSQSFAWWRGHPWRDLCLGRWSVTPGLATAGRTGPVDPLETSGRSATAFPVSCLERGSGLGVNAGSVSVRDGRTCVHSGRPAAGLCSPARHSRVCSCLHLQAASPAPSRAEHPSPQRWTCCLRGS